MDARKWRVLVVDDQLLVQAGVAALLEPMPDFECVGCAGGGAQALALYEARQPDIVLLDIRMPGMDGLAVARALRERASPARIVFLSSEATPERVGQALEASALGLISKDFVLDELEHALRCVAAGRVYVSPQASVALAQSRTAPRVRLSPRQRQILALIARGRPNKAMAQELGITLKTVEFHRAELIRRLDLHDVASLTRYAIEHGVAG